MAAFVVMIAVFFKVLAVASALPKFLSKDFSSLLGSCLAGTYQTMIDPASAW